MAKFQDKVWLEGDSSNPAGALLATTILWLRTLDGDIGYENLIRLCVPFSNDLYFGNGLPSAPLGYHVVSDGKVFQSLEVGSFSWARHWHSRLGLHYYEHVSRETKIHMDWIEWALATAIVKLTEAGIQWLPINKPKTIGGLEVADLDF